MTLITKKTERDIAGVLVQMHHLIEANSGRVVSSVADELIAGIRDIAEHAGGEVKMKYLEKQWACVYSPIGCQKDHERFGR